MQKKAPGIWLNLIMDRPNDSISERDNERVEENSNIPTNSEVMRWEDLR